MGQNNNKNGKYKRWFKLHDHLNGTKYSRMDQVKFVDDSI